MKRLLLALLLSSCTAPVVVPTTEAPPAASVPAQTVTLEKSCPSPGVYGAVDASMPFTQRALFAMRALGVKTVIRYYEYPQETIKGKTPSIAELKLIEANGLSMLAVFQHNNSSFSTFTAARGASDAARAVELAGLWKQPKGSAVYFGVDGDWGSASQQAAVKTYIGAAAPIVAHAGFKLGVYGSGQVCTNIRDKAGLADFCWISDATGHTGTADYKKTGKQNLVQFLPTDCGGINVDFNKVYTADFGQWKVSL